MRRIKSSDFLSDLSMYLRVVAKHFQFPCSWISVSGIPFEELSVAPPRLPECSPYSFPS